MRRIAKWLSSAGITLNVLDLGTTIYAVGTLGAVEANPLIAPFIMHPLFWAVKLVIGTLIFFWMGRGAATDKRWMGALVVGVLLYVIIVLNNVLGIIGSLLGLY